MNTGIYRCRFEQLKTQYPEHYSQKGLGKKSFSNFLSPCDSKGEILVTALDSFLLGHYNLELILSYHSLENEAIPVFLCDISQF